MTNIWNAKRVIIAFVLNSKKLNDPILHWNPLQWDKLYGWEESDLKGVNNQSMYCIEGIME